MPEALEDGGNISKTLTSSSFSTEKPHSTIPLLFKNDSKQIPKPMPEVDRREKTRRRSLQNPPLITIFKPSKKVGHIFLNAMTTVIIQVAQMT